MPEGRGDALRPVVLAALLLAFWLVLSGHYTPFLVAAGIGCTVLCVLAALRMCTLDAESLPLRLFPGAIIYFPWLLVEIAKSAWSVTKIVLHPRLPISPVMTVVTASQRTSAGIATYANSITLTPGTITVGMEGNALTVHALTREGALDLESGGMDARVRQFEGSS